MTRQDFLKAIQTGQLQGAYLLEGEEEALKQEALSLLRRAILPEGLEELNETVLTDPDTASIRAAAETMPFMAEHRLVIIRDCSAITGRKEADPALRDYLSAVPPSAVLVFIVTGKASGTKALVKALKKANHLVTFDRLKGDELNRWVLQGFEQAGKKCSLPVAARLVFVSGSDTASLRGEIEKISAYAGDRAEITLSDITAVATPGAEYRVFDIINAVTAGQSAKALSLLQELLRSGEETVGILALLLRQFRLMQHAKIMQYEKLPPQEISSQLGGGYAAESILRTARSYTGGQVRKGVQLLLEAEWKLKSGQLNQEGLAETTLLQLFSLRDR